MKVANIYILSLVSLVLAFMSTCQVIHLSSSSCGPCIAVDTVVALPRSAFQTSYSFLHLLGVLAAEGSQLSPSLGNEIQKGAALPKVILPSLEEWRENLYPMTDGFRAHRSWALLWSGITPKAHTYSDVYRTSWTLCYNCRACQLLPRPNQLASIISYRR